MTRRYYANAAPQQQLAAEITAGATSLTVSGSFAGWPIQFPYHATLDLGTASAEVVLVTAVVGTTATVTRAQDGTAAITHAAGATFDQTVVRADFDEANAHVNASTGVHGVSGSVVGTSDAQTLTNKILTTPTVNGAALSGTFSGDHTVSGAATFSKAGTALAVTNNATVGGTLGVTGDLTAAKATAVLIPKTFANEAAAGTQPQGSFVFLSAPTHAWGAGLYCSAGGGTWYPAGSDQAWKAYTPVLTASVTNPTLGTGGVTTGKVVVIGKAFVVDITVAFGTAAANAGSGTYAISLPWSTSFGASGVTGFGHIKCAGLYTNVQAILSGSPASTVNLYYTSAAVNGTLNSVTHAAPGAWTNNDLIRLRLTGEMA